MTTRSGDEDRGYDPGPRERPGGYDPGPEPDNEDEDNESEEQG